MYAEIMAEGKHGRRAFLSAAAAAGAGITQFSAARASETTNACTRTDDSGSNAGWGEVDSLAGTDSETTTTEAPASESTSLDVSIAELDVSLDTSVIDSGVEGPTAFVVGGVHGDEEAGYRAADQILDWTPDAGRLVVLPRANPTAIAQNTRTTDAGDLNRHFLVDDGPTTPLAQALWDIVEQVEPDAVLSLHESQGIYGSEPSGVGQAIFHSHGARDAAQMGINRANRTIRKRRIMFERGLITSPSIAPSGLFTEKTAYEADIPSFIIETYEELPLDARIRWQKMITKGVLDYLDLYN
ncbi:succinylglutamate desuccinylase/aspartoacylase family protein [Halocatena marina]|uniref:Succinylglutamate desuccinylase/aspartoacylase family protein n=2 Tax=Halocatena marina TaxID=2934937 RepID=A0ABD5YPT3_9EURY